jgi:nucleoside-diphosphate-sugar epimerase
MCTSELWTILHTRKNLMGAACLERTAGTALGTETVPDERASRLRGRVGSLASNSAIRGAGKIALDFGCGAVSVLIGVGFGQSSVPLGGSVTLLALAVGALIGLAAIVRGSHRVIWRYTSFRELATLGLFGATVLTSLLIVKQFALPSLSGASVLLSTLLSLFGWAGARVARRWQLARAEQRERQHGETPVAGTRRVLIVGAGITGTQLARDIVHRASSDVELVGFLDDDVAKRGATVNGARVLGPLSAAMDVVEHHGVTEVIVALPSAPPKMVRAFVRQLEEVGVRVRTLPGVDRIVHGGDVRRPGTATLRELIDQSVDRPVVRNADSAVRRVLVTGGAGFIGSHLTRLLLDRGYYVRVLDRFDYGRDGLANLRHPRLEVIQGDICNTRDLNHTMRDVDGVIALAAIVGDPACNLDPEETINLNYTATKLLVDACNFHGVRRLVFASSCSVYGASNHDLLTERSRLSPVSLYARTRVLSENIIFDRYGDVEPVVLRLSTVFGLSPRMRFDLVVNTLTVRAVVDKKISIFGGDQWRPNVHCRDAARAFMLALEAPAPAVAGEIFNVGGESLNHTISEIGLLVARTVGGVEVGIQDEVNDRRDYRVSFEKIRRALAFVPEMSVEDGIREVAAAVRRDAALQLYQSSNFSNVQALRQRLERLPEARELVSA